jgi:predicted 2-oxoglutarate/Fe(II)-dependent dioxygenase YbiX
MPPPDFFRKFNFFVRHEFLSAQECSDLRQQIRTGHSVAAEVYTGRDSTVLPQERSTLKTFVPLPAQLPLRERIAQLLPEFERQFSATFSEIQDFEFLRYRPGDFFYAHRDSSRNPAQPELVRRRRVSIILFLNDHDSIPAERFAGGSLLFYGLLPDEKLANFGFELTPMAGVLVAFQSHLMHEVKPVTEGERFTAVTWIA